MSTLDIRAIGDVDQVDELLSQLDKHFTFHASRPYTVRGRDDQVRIYLTALKRVPVVPSRVEYTHPDVLAAAVAGAGWADPIDDPTRIDWTERQRHAAIPFPVVNNRPVNPCETTPTRFGRNELGHWGEQLCADALVTALDLAGHRWILMVERADGHGWALPGGYVDPGEDPAEAAVRELAEETSLTLPYARWTLTAPRYVPDPRASDEAWMVTVLATTTLGPRTREDFPTPVGADDARRAVWVPADSYQLLTDELARAYGGEVFAAHRTMLAAALDTGVQVTP